MADTCPACTDDHLCSECAADFELLKRHPDPIQRLADLTWLADYWEQTAPSIAADLRPTDAELRELLDDGGRETVVRVTSELVLVTRLRAEREEREAS